MSEGYMIIACDNDRGLLRLTQIVNKLLPGQAEFQRIDDKRVLLTVKKGVHDLAIIKASYSALTMDNDYLHQAMIIPTSSSIYYPYLDLVPNRQITELFKVAKYNPQVYDELYDLVAGLDREVLQTVKVYIENDCSPLLASYSLFVHKNTVTYRINFFIKQTGIALDNFANQMFLYNLISSHDAEQIDEY